MKYTSAEAAKLLRSLNEAHSALSEKEKKCETFLVSVGEDVESVRPEYDYRAVRAQLDELEEKIRRVKHAINTFNLTHVVPGFDMTVDQMLVYIPQLNTRKAKLPERCGRLPKTRENNAYGRSNTIDYRYINYELSSTEADLKKVSDTLSRAQTTLDVVNNSEALEIDVTL